MEKKRFMPVLALFLVLMSLVGFPACEKGETGLESVPIMLGSVDRVFVASYADMSNLTKEPKANVIKVNLTIANPTTALVAINYMHVELYIDEVLWGVDSLPGYAYVPPGKKIELTFVFTPLTYTLIQQVVMLESKPIPAAVGAVLGTMKAIEKGEATYLIDGEVGLSTETGATNQTFSFSWPSER
jgi:hypothetical protein